MSKKKQHHSKHEGHLETAAEQLSHAEPMSALKRWGLIFVAIFCLLIFSVTPSMTQMFGNLFSGGPPVQATMVLPDGSAADITITDYQAARRSLTWEARFFGARGPEEDTESILAYAALVKLADAFEIEVVDEELSSFLQMILSQTQQDYQTFYQRMGFSRALDLEGLLRELMRIQKLGTMLASGAVPTHDDVLANWSKRYSEMRYDYMVWSAEDFTDVAALETPDDEALAAFFESDLTLAQKRTLENEEAIAFEALVLSAEALQSEVVKGWADTTAPEDEALQGFYDFRRYSLYQRPADERTPENGIVLTREEVGERLMRDFQLQRAAQAMLDGARDVADLSVYAAERGVEYIVEASPVGRAALADLDRIGTPELAQLFQTETGSWMANVILLSDGMAIVARPTEQLDRAMPELAEVHDSVVDYWRERRQVEMAREAAEAFVAALPKGDDAVEGDPAVVDAAAFVAEGIELQSQDWISREVRPTVDPVWSKDDNRGPWLRSMLGRQLDETLDGQVIGPLEQGMGETYVVARLAERREADAEGMWPGELDRARQMATSELQRNFQLDLLSFTGLAKSYELTKVIFEESGEEAGL